MYLLISSYLRHEQKTQRKLCAPLNEQVLTCKNEKIIVTITSSFTFNTTIQGFQYFSNVPVLHYL